MRIRSSAGCSKPFARVAEVTPLSPSAVAAIDNLELAARLVVEGLRSGRSYGNGKQMFQVANCVACHKLDGVGTEIGPDLAKLDPKLGSLDILKELLDPSVRINEKYQTYTFELESGKVVTGLILSEDKDRIKVIENPLAKAEPAVLRKSDIVERKKSPTSVMPKGLLDKLTREEILDLIAYVASRGDSRNKLFQHDHGH